MSDPRKNPNGTHDEHGCRVWSDEERAQIREMAMAAIPFDPTGVVVDGLTIDDGEVAS